MKFVKVILQRSQDHWILIRPMNTMIIYLYDKNMRVFSYKTTANLYWNYFERKCFPKEWKKANIVPVHKKMINN